MKRRRHFRGQAVRRQRAGHGIAAAARLPSHAQRHPGAVQGAPDGALVALLAARAGGNRFPVRHLRLSGPRRYAELLGDAAQHHVEMQFPHPGNQDLPRLLALADHEGGILTRHDVERVAQAGGVGGGVRLDGGGDDRFRKAHSLQQQAGAGAAHGIAGLHVLETDRHGDVAGVQLGQWLRPIGVHAQQPADPLASAADRVVHRVAGP